MFFFQFSFVYFGDEEQKQEKPSGSNDFCNVFIKQS